MQTSAEGVPSVPVRGNPTTCVRQIDSAQCFIRPPISARSNSAKAANISNTSRPLAVVVSIDAPSPASTFRPMCLLPASRVGKLVAATIFASQLANALHCCALPIFRLGNLKGLAVCDRSKIRLSEPPI